MLTKFLKKGPKPKYTFAVWDKYLSLMANLSKYLNLLNNVHVHFSFQFLECCTDKLGLPFAARRVFLEGGEEIFDAEDIPLDGEVYVSCGENYKDPLANVKRKITILILSLEVFQ